VLTRGAAAGVLDVPIIVVDTHDRTKLHALVEDTRVVASTAGPFALHGSNAVEFCARFGTSWCDITGEVRSHLYKGPLHFCGSLT
jgi:short subunit dehydrogenase-like uncharacterized protein